MMVLQCRINGVQPFDQHAFSLFCGSTVESLSAELLSADILFERHITGSLIGCSTAVCDLSTGFLSH